MGAIFYSGPSLYRWLFACTEPLADTIVVANGCFDMLHDGHRSLLRFAKAYRREGATGPTHVVVLLNGDESVKRLKGPGRPAWHFSRRAESLMVLPEVSAILKFNEGLRDTLHAMRRLDLLHAVAKGSDYQADQVIAPTGMPILLAPYLDGFSTTLALAEAEPALSC